MVDHIVYISCAWTFLSEREIVSILDNAIGGAADIEYDLEEKFFVLRCGSPEQEDVLAACVSALKNYVAAEHQIASENDDQSELPKVTQLPETTTCSLYELYQRAEKEDRPSIPAPSVPLFAHEAVKSQFSSSMALEEAQKQFSSSLLQQLQKSFGCRVEWNASELVVIADDTECARKAVLALGRLDSTFTKRNLSKFDLYDEENEVGRKYRFIWPRERITDLAFRSIDVFYGRYYEIATVEWEHYSCQWRVKEQRGKAIECSEGTQDPWSNDLHFVFGGDGNILEEYSASDKSVAHSKSQHADQIPEEPSASKSSLNEEAAVRHHGEAKEPLSDPFEDNGGFLKYQQNQPTATPFGSMANQTRVDPTPSREASRQNTTFQHNIPSPITSEQGPRMDGSDGRTSWHDGRPSLETVESRQPTRHRNAFEQQIKHGGPRAYHEYDDFPVNVQPVTPDEEPSRSAGLISNEPTDLLGDIPSEDMSSHPVLLPSRPGALLPHAPFPRALLTAQVQSTNEKDTRIYRRNPNLKAASKKALRKEPKNSLSSRMRKAISGILRHAKALEQNKAVLEVLIGKCYVDCRTVPGTFRPTGLYKAPEPFSVGDWGTMFRTCGQGDKASSLFSRNITSLWMDAKFIQDMTESMSEPLFQRDADSSERVFFLVRCRNEKAGEDMSVEIEQDGRFTVRGFEATVGCASVHYLRRKWDAAFLVTEALELKHQQHSLGEFIENISIRPSTESSPRFYHTKTAGFTLKSVEFRRTITHDVPRFPGIQLRLTRVERLRLEDWPGDKVLGRSLHPEDIIRGGYLWWEACLVSGEINDALEKKVEDMEAWIQSDSVQRNLDHLLQVCQILVSNMDSIEGCFSNTTIARSVQSGSQQLESM